MLTAYEQKQREKEVKQLILKGMETSTIHYITKASSNYIARIRRKMEIERRREYLDNF